MKTANKIFPYELSRNFDKINETDMPVFYYTQTLKINIIINTRYYLISVHDLFSDSEGILDLVLYDLFFVLSND